MRHFIIAFIYLLGQEIIAQPAPVTPKAKVTSENIDSIISFERVFSQNSTTPAPPGKKSFEFKSGNKKILFIAGHATAHKREGQTKPADSGTGSMAVSLNKLLRAPALYSTFLSQSDPNFEDANDFKDSLAKLLTKIKPVFVIDLHASNSFRPYDIDFGTMNGKSFLNRKDLLNSLKVFLKNEGLINQSQDFFPAEQNQTITKFVSNKGFPCIQLEINSNYISAKDGDLFGQKTAQLLQALIRFVESQSN